MIESFHGEHRYLSNFWPVEIKYNGLIFKSVESAYQASKCKDKEDMHMFSDLSAYDAKKLGRKIEIREDWEDVRIDIMKDLIALKFHPESNLLNALVRTYPNKIVEGNHWNDTFWGICRGEGENNLGKILMEHREKYLK
jgi:ribA/ribD-fused uncharacterized protein